MTYAKSSSLVKSLTCTTFLFAGFGFGTAPSKLTQLIF